MIGNQAASTYAKAIFSAIISGKDNSTNSLEQNLQLLNDILLFINDNLNLKFALYAPVIGLTYKNRIIENIAVKLKLPINIHNLLLILAKNQRFNLLESIVAKFSNLIKNNKELIEAEIISAKQLSITDFTATKNMLTKKYAKNFIFTQTTNPNLLGGLVVKFDNKILDASINGVLKKFNIKSRELISVL